VDKGNGRWEGRRKGWKRAMSVREKIMRKSWKETQRL